MEGFLPALLPLSLLTYFGGYLDFVLLVAFKTFKEWNSVQPLVQAPVNPTIVIEALKGLATLCAGIQVARFIGGLLHSETFSDEFPVKPMFFPCQTSHIRMFPKKHGFSYSYLLVGIPVGWKGNAGGMISTEEEQMKPWYLRLLSMRSGKAWYTVSSDNYLGRGHVKDGLRGKLREYLKSQGIDHERYAYAYLLTAAEFLNYSFNPISVWYLYSAQKELKALVLEVNNTSDERHMYFLEPTPQYMPSKDAAGPQSVRYTDNWSKDFYVSTFNDRSGKYSIAVYDPLFPFMSRAGSINTTITLSSADSRAMLVARLYSAGQAKDPSSMSVWAKTKFLVSWWWVGFVTFLPRTIYEAFRLFFRRKVPWVSRPEPRKHSMPRHANETEIFIEKNFRQYFRDKVVGSGKDLVVRYIPSGLVGHSASEIRIARTTACGTNEVEFRVLTPAFYSRIIQYADIYAGLLLESQSETISISNHELLKPLDFGPPAMQGFMEISLAGLCFALVERFRAEVTPIPLLEKPDSADVIQVTPKSPYGSSAFDRYIFATTSPAEQYEYASGVLKLLAAERFALGWMEILEMEIFTGRVVAAWLLAQFLLL